MRTTETAPAGRLALAAQAGGTTSNGHCQCVLGVGHRLHRAATDERDRLVSWGGKTAWQVLNADMADSLDNVLIGDLAGNGTDDVLRYAPLADGGSKWQVSRGGRTGWQPLDNNAEHGAMASGFIGRFEDGNVPELLVIGDDRMSSVFNPATQSFSPYNPYAY